MTLFCINDFDSRKILYPLIFCAMLDFIMSRFIVKYVSKFISALLGVVTILYGFKEEL